MGVARELNESANAAARLGNAVGNAFRPSTWKAAAERSAIAAADAASKVPGWGSRAANLIGEMGSFGGKVIGSFFAFPFRVVGGFASPVLSASTKAGIAIVETPFAVAMKPVKWTFNGAAKIFERAPIVSLGVTAVATALGIGGWIAKNNGEKLQREAFEAQVAANRAAQRSPYMNSVTPEDAALLEARMRNSANGASHGEAVMNARQPAPKPENAAGAPVEL